MCIKLSVLCIVSVAVSLPVPFALCKLGAQLLPPDRGFCFCIALQSREQSAGLSACLLGLLLVLLCWEGNAAFFFLFFA